MIAFDAIIFDLQRAGGISRYSFELLSRLFKDARLSSVYYGGGKNIFADELSLPWRRESYIPVAFRRYLPFLGDVPRGSIFHSSYYRVSNQKDVYNITTVHDFTYERYIKGSSGMVHSIQKRRAVRSSQGIICISENTKKDLCEFYGINDANVRVIHNGVGDEFFPLGAEYPVTFAMDQQRPFALFIGDRSRYKNFDKAVRAVREVKELQLVIVGGGAITADERRLLSNMIDRVVVLGSIASQDLNYLYNKAHCLLYPSEYEGFGLPVLEAMKAGCPVIALDKSSIPEVAQDAALLLASSDTDLIVESILHLFDTEHRAILIKKGLSQAAKFSWDRCYRETVRYYYETAST